MSDDSAPLSDTAPSQITSLFIFTGGEGDIGARLLAQLEAARLDPAVVKYGVVLSPEIVARAVLVEGLMALEARARASAPVVLSASASAPPPVAVPMPAGTTEALMDGGPVGGNDADVDADDTYDALDFEAQLEAELAALDAEEDTNAGRDLGPQWMMERPKRLILADVADHGKHVADYGVVKITIDGVVTTQDGALIHHYFAERGWMRYRATNGAKHTILYAPLVAKPLNAVERDGLPHSNLTIAETNGPMAKSMPFIVAIPPALQ